MSEVIHKIQKRRLEIQKLREELDAEERELDIAQSVVEKLDVFAIADESLAAATLPDHPSQTAPRLLTNETSLEACRILLQESDEEKVHFAILARDAMARGFGTGREESVVADSFRRMMTKQSREFVNQSGGFFSIRADYHEIPRVDGGLTGRTAKDAALFVLSATADSMHAYDIADQALDLGYRPPPTATRDTVHRTFRHALKKISSDQIERTAPATYRLVRANRESAETVSTKHLTVETLNDPLGTIRVPKEVAAKVKKTLAKGAKPKPKRK